MIKVNENGVDGATWSLLEQILENPYLWNPVSDLMQLQNWNLSAKALQKLIMEECISDVYLNDDEINEVDWQILADELVNTEKREEPAPAIEKVYILLKTNENESAIEIVSVHSTEEGAVKAEERLQQECIEEDDPGCESWEDYSGSWQIWIEEKELSE